MRSGVGFAVTPAETTFSAACKYESPAVGGPPRDLRRPWVDSRQQAGGEVLLGGHGGPGQGVGVS